MTTGLPLVFSKGSLPRAILYLSSCPPFKEGQNIGLDSPAWFRFLAQEHPFRFSYHLPQGGLLTLTVRPEKRASGTYWQAWQTVAGQTTVKYLAPTAHLTKATLDAAGQWFLAHGHFQPPDDPTRPLYTALTDLTWLLQRLIAHCPQPDLAQLAQRELARIQQEVL